MKKGGEVSGDDFSRILEDYHRDQNIMSRDMMRQPAGISNNLRRDNKTGMKKPRVKPQKKY